MSGAANAAYLSPFPSTRLQAPLSPPLPAFGACFPGWGAHAALGKT